MCVWHNGRGSALGVLPHQPADAASQRQTTNAGGRNQATSSGKTVRLCGRVEANPPCAALRRRDAMVRVDPDIGHIRQIDDDTAVAHPVTRDPVPTSAYGQRQLIFTGQAYRGRDVTWSCDTSDQRRIAVDGAVPYPVRHLVSSSEGWISRPRKQSASAPIATSGSSIYMARWWPDQPVVVCDKSSTGVEPEPLFLP
jgi:hypothetical protein